MSVYKALSKRSHVVIVSFISITILMLSIQPKRIISSSTRSRDVQVKNQTESLQAVDIEQTEKNLTLRLKNTSHKEINGYTLLLSDGGTITTDYTNTGLVLAPGEITEAVIPLDTSLPSGQATLRQSVTVLAVMFTDHTSDGDSKAATYIKDRRSGVKMQIKRITSLIRNIMIAPNSDASATLIKLQSLIEALPEYAEGSSSLAVHDGLYDAKQDALMMLQRLEQKRLFRQTSNLEDFQAELAQELAEFEKRDSRF